MVTLKHPILLFLLLSLVMIYPQIMGRTSSQNTKNTKYVFFRAKSLSPIKKRINILSDSLHKERQKLKTNMIVIIKQQDTLKKYNVQKTRQ